MQLSKLRPYGRGGTVLDGIMICGGKMELELKAKIEAAEKAVKEAEAEIAKAKAAGVDVSDLEKDLAEQKEALRKLREAYGK